MKKLILFLLMMVPIISLAKDLDNEEYYVYCGINVSGNNTVYVFFDFNKNYEALYDENNKPLKMIEVEAINYMSRLGWEYVESIYSKSALYDHYFLFKKKVKSDEEILHGFIFKEKKKK